MCFVDSNACELALFMDEGEMAADMIQFARLGSDVEEACQRMARS
jgi:hypothetical protein